MRASMLEVLNLDYVRTARAKGLDETHVVTRHVLRTPCSDGDADRAGRPEPCSADRSWSKRVLAARPRASRYESVWQRDLITLSACLRFRLLVIVVNFAVDSSMRGSTPRISAS